VCGEGAGLAAEGGEEFVEFQAEFFGVGVGVGGVEGGDGRALHAAG
jgi:hypothetical protein